MASRVASREAARERRLEHERAAVARARRRRRTLAGVLGLAVIVVGVAIAISVGGGGGRGPVTGRAASTVGAQVRALLAGVPQHGTTLGDPAAPVTLTFYGDLQCPVCAAFATGGELEGVPPVGGLPRFIATRVRDGRAKVVYRSLCTATCGDFGRRGPGLFVEQQTAAEAAGEQDRFWDYEQLFYREQGPEGSPYVTPAFLSGLARQTPGLDVARWNADRGSSALAASVTRDEALAVAQLPVVDGGRGTPGLAMSGPRGSRVVAEGLVGIAQLDAAFAAVS